MNNEIETYKGKDWISMWKQLSDDHINVLLTIKRLGESSINKNILSSL